MRHNTVSNEYVTAVTILTMTHWILSNSTMVYIPQNSWLRVRRRA